MVHTINTPPHGPGSFEDYLGKAIDVGRHLGSFSPSSGSPPSGATASSSSSVNTAGVLSAAATVDSTTSDSTLSTLLDRVDKFGLAIVILVVVNLVLGLLLIVSACSMWIRKGRDTSRSTISSYTPVRFRDSAPPADEEASASTNVKYDYDD